MQPPASTPPGAVSSDGRWIWNGVQWVPAYASQGAPPITAAGVVPAVSDSAKPRSLLAIIGGVTAILAEAIILASYVIPYVRYDGFGSQASHDYAVFYGCVYGQSATTCSYAPLPWGIATAGAMILVGLVAAILVIVFKARVAVAISSGALMALGIQELSDWVSFVSSKDNSGAHLEIGIAVGILGALLLFIGGLMPALSLVTHRS
jgi:hypothetical protein